VNHYEVRFQPWDGFWSISEPVGANGRLLFQSAREAANHAKWEVEIDALKWTLAKRFPERYAERVKTENTNLQKGEIKLSPELKAQLLKIREISAKIKPPSWKQDGNSSHGPHGLSDLED